MQNLIVVPPGWRNHNNTHKEAPQKCRILLLPDTAAELLQSYKAECVVSYGLSEKSTITLSSIMDNEAVVAIQRELPTIDGELLERQEISLRRPEGLSEENFLAVIGTFLITGTPPEKLAEML